MWIFFSSIKVKQMSSFENLRKKLEENTKRQRGSRLKAPQRDAFFPNWFYCEILIDGKIKLRYLSCPFHLTIILPFIISMFLQVSLATRSVLSPLNILGLSIRNSSLCNWLKLFSITLSEFFSTLATLNSTNLMDDYYMTWVCFKFFIFNIWLWLYSSLGNGELHILPK